MLTLVVICNRILVLFSHTIKPLLKIHRVQYTIDRVDADFRFYRRAENINYYLRCIPLLLISIY